MMKRTIAVILTIVLFVTGSFAQSSSIGQNNMLQRYISNLSPFSFTESKALNSRKSSGSDIHKFFFSLGASNFLGDLGGANRIGSEAFSMRDLDVQAIRPAIQMGYIYRFSHYLAWRSSFDYIWLSGNDKWTQETFRHNRNLNFRTPTYGLTSSIVVLFDIKKSRHGYKKSRIGGSGDVLFTPYAQIGIGGLYFSSKGKYQSSWHRLKPLCTEGETLVPTRKKYSSVQFTVPMGVGLRFKVADNWEVGIEYSQWLTFTDYLDDVSTTYIDENALFNSKGQLAVDMANPALDNTPDKPLYNSTLPGQQRGDPRDKDHFIALSFTLYYTITEGYTPKLRF